MAAKTENQTGTEKETKSNRSENTEASGTGDTNDVFKLWADNYTETSKMWEETFMKLQHPWIETTESLMDKASELTKESSPKEFQIFYDEWMKTYQDTMGKFYPIHGLESNQETLKQFMASAEEISKMFKTWSARFEANTEKTREVLKDMPDAQKYKESFDMWMKSYEELFEQFTTLPNMKNTRSIFEQYAGVPDIYFESISQMTKLWKNAFNALYEPWIEATTQLTPIITKISSGNASKEDYQEFTNSWLASNKEIIEKYFQNAQPSQGAMESFMESTSTYLNMYRSWISALEKMAEKTSELSRQSNNPATSSEFYGLWVKMYEKAFDSFFDDMPLAGPMKQMMEPAKVMAKIYGDTFSRMSQMWFSKDSSFKAKI